MAAAIKLLIDEDTHLALAGALRKRGHDAVHVRESERLGVSDDEQIKYAVAQERCFVTFNVGEFVVLHGEYVKNGWEHFGVVVSPQKPLGRLLRDLLAFLQSHTADEARGQLFFL